MATLLKQRTQFKLLEGITIKPPLKWAGGKRWLIPHLQLLWREHTTKRLVEPFCGGMAVSLGLLPKEAILNDINPHTINFYEWLKQGLTIRMDMQNDEEAYYKHRERFNELVTQGKETTKEAAGLFYYLNRTGYNGLCRFNQQGEFNVPFGSYKTINYEQNFKYYKKILESWKFQSDDFENLNIKPDDFIYADPPYDVDFTQYSKESFSWDDQVRLAHWLAKHPGPCVLSGQATRRIVQLYNDLGFKLQFLSAPRMISCNGDRTRQEEILATRGI